MKCFNCGAEAPVGNKFCPRCGASMSVGQAGSAGMPQTANGNHNAGQVNPVNVNPGNIPPGYQNPGQINQGYPNPGQPNTGYPNPGYPGGGYPVQGGSSATASMILGIVSDALMVIGMFLGASSQKSKAWGLIEYVDETTRNMGVAVVAIALICSLIGFILAIVALKNKTPKKGKAVTGLICNGLIAVPGLLGIMFFIIMLLSI